MHHRLSMPTLALAAISFVLLMTLQTDLALAQSQPTNAAATQPVQVLGQIGGITRAVAVVGQRAYIGEGPRLTVLDITNPAQPVLLGKSAPLPGATQAIKMVGNLAYLAANEGGLRVVDVSDPTRPREIGFYDTPDSSWDLHVLGNLAYVADGSSGLLIIDVSTPSAPVLLGTQKTKNYANGVFVVGTTAYVSDGAGSGLRVINVANPASPSEIGAYETPGFGFDVVVAGNFAYVADYITGLRVVNIVDPTNPIEIGAYDTPGYAVNLAVNGNLVYLADNHGGMRVIDVTNPANPTLRNIYDTPGRAVDVAAANNLVYVADEAAGLQIGNSNTLTATLPVGSYHTVGDARGIFVADNTAYVADEVGLVTVDVTTPTQPSLLDSFITGGAGRDVTAASSDAYVADGDTGLQVIGTFPLTELRHWSTHNTPGSARAVAVQNDRVYVADGTAGLRVINVSSAVTPSEVGFLDTLGEANGLFLAGTRLFLADGPGGLRLINIANPAAPTQLTAYQTTGDARGVYAVGNTAYVAAGEAGLRVVDVSNLNNPAEIGFYDTTGRANAVHIVGNLAYVADHYNGLRIIDISNPASPSEVNSFQTRENDYAEDVFVHNGVVYVAYGSNGLWLLRYPPCYRLTRRHTGNGADPSAAPPNSTGCPSGEYRFLESISLSATPDPAWRITSWVGTNNDNTTAKNNVVTMPAAEHEVTVVYAPTCYTLALGHTGTGADPTPTPANSVGCAAGQYVANETITLRAAPGTGYTVGSWSGTTANSSSALENSLAMPASDHTASVTYVLACYALTLTHSGQGAAPTATPGQSAGCPAGRYHFTESIALSATPAAGWQIGSWSGTSNNSATSAANSLVMPANDHTVSVNYAEPPLAGPGDSYETDGVCTRSRGITTDGSEVQDHSFHAVADTDWVHFTANSGQHYRIEVQVPVTSTADVNLEVYVQCEAAAFDRWNASFSPGARLDITAPASGPIYLRLANQDANLAGNNVRYTVSVRNLSNEAGKRALILVAGRLTGGDRLQKNIHNVTNAVYKLFQANGYDESNIQYLATDSTLPGYDEALTRASLRAAITTWAKEQVGSDGVLNLYLMDHGSPDLFYLDELSNQRLTPDDLNGWLGELESAAPNVKVNVFIEACQSGSFITPPGSISKAGRVVITSSNAENDAKASKDGAYFSDHLLTWLRQGYNLAAAFDEASSVARAIFSLQRAMLDADGNGIPNEFGDSNTAAKRSFAYASSLGNEWPPHIFAAQPLAAVNDQKVRLRVDVRDDKSVNQVWAVVYEPGYTPPSTSQTLQPEVLPTVLFVRVDNDNHWEAEITGLNKAGVYQVIIHADDEQGLVARPVSVAVAVNTFAPTENIYLPLVGK